jgi:hypothetical protein
MKQAFLTSLFALNSFSVFANTDAPTSSADQQIADLQKQLEIAKLKAEIAKASATPTPAVPTVVINNNLSEKTNSDNVTQPAPAAPPIVVMAPAPVVPSHDLPPGVMPSSNDYLNWTFRVWEAISTHNSNFLTSFTADGQVNYFGRTKTFDRYIAADMANDAIHYVRYHNQYNLDSFRHDISDEYSSRWDGPMIYDSLTVYQEVWERNGVYHHANVRFTVGYTLPDNRVYALVLKVL